MNNFKVIFLCLKISELIFKSYQRKKNKSILVIKSKPFLLQMKHIGQPVVDIIFAKDLGLLHDLVSILHRDLCRGQRGKTFGSEVLHLAGLSFQKVQFVLDEDLPSISCHFSWIFEAVKTTSQINQVRKWLQKSEVKVMFEIVLINLKNYRINRVKSIT